MSGENNIENVDENCLEMGSSVSSKEMIEAVKEEEGPSSEIYQPPHETGSSPMVPALVISSHEDGEDSTRHPNWPNTPPSDESVTNRQDRQDREDEEANSQGVSPQLDSLRLVD